MCVFAQFWYLNRHSTQFLTPCAFQCLRLCSDTTVYDADKADVWALGLTMLVTLTGYFPWGAAHGSDANFAAWITAWSRVVSAGVVRSGVCLCLCRVESVCVVDTEMEIVFAWALSSLRLWGAYHTSLLEH